MYGLDCAKELWIEFFVATIAAIANMRASVILATILSSWAKAKTPSAN
jgi:hypothetical protein